MHSAKKKLEANSPMQRTWQAITRQLADAPDFYETTAATYAYNKKRNYFDKVTFEKRGGMG